jgi:hypothetical protein
MASLPNSRRADVAASEHPEPANSLFDRSKSPGHPGPPGRGPSDCKELCRLLPALWGSPKATERWLAKNPLEGSGHPGACKFEVAC